MILMKQWTMPEVLDRLVDNAARTAALAAERAELLSIATTLRLAEAPTESHGVAMRSLTAEIGCATHTAEGTVTRLLNDAETLVHSLPATMAALRAGAIQYRHAQIMVTHAQSLPPEARGPFEDEVLPVAVDTTPPKFDRTARRARELAHPESIEIRTLHATADRHVRIEPDIDGMAWLTCHLPAVQALAIDDRLDTAARALRSDTETRTHTQLRADLLADALLGGTGLEGVVPTVTLTVPVLSLIGYENDPAELAGYGPIDLPTARRVAANAPSFIRILTHPDTGHTLTVGRERYRATADMRLALRLADQTCRFPGCNRRAERCELDHTTPWAHGGTTHPGNLHHLCPKHHHLKHDNTGWTVASGPNRTLHWTAPTGRRYTTHPPGPTPPTHPVFREQPDDWPKRK
jgi:hypothetical protein